MIQKALNFGKRFIDYKMGIAGSIVMGGLVFCINYFPANNFSGSMTAALKQGSYTFLFGGILMKGCESIAKRLKNKTFAIAMAVLIPSALTLTLTYAVHNLKGTPKPFESTLPTLIIIPATAIWGYMKRKEYETAKN
jgi:hypothetical protein